MSGSPPPTTVAEWVAQRRAHGAVGPLEKVSSSGNILNIRRVGPAENGGNPTNNRSTDRLSISSPAATLNPLVERRLDATFVALADPTRRGMLADLMRGEKSVGELAGPYAMSFAGAAKHIGMLERAGLVKRRKVGRQQICRLRAEPLREVAAYLHRGYGNGLSDTPDGALAAKPDSAGGRYERETTKGCR